MSGSVGDNVFRASGVIAAAAAGRTGTVDWDTSSIKTSTFTAESGNGYFCNTAINFTQHCHSRISKQY